MKEIGYIKSVKDGYASVIFKRKSGCGDNCPSCKAGCGSKSIATDVKDTLGVSIGDTVEIDMPTKSFFTMTFWTYTFPLIMLVIGLVGSILIFKNLDVKKYELLGTAVGLVFLAISYSILSHMDKKLGKKQSYNLKMTRILNK
ncbi:SoxR reducing system RseC family protein [Clostridium sp. Marseille-Q2269]|uniref:SoxR reducing system RseC family protein n=1 Tax=Clostridium sp. Marseille-Q2269 TaxID=2942205 RepID=UPI002072FF47|nr:SoxR reducing system RseC family protein [Clostridium sp. Marseille-Q2269]